MPYDPPIPPPQPRPFARFWHNVEIACLFLLLAFLAFIFIVPQFTRRIEGNIHNRHPLAELANLSNALENFEIDTGRYPTTAEGLDALVHRPPDTPNWAHKYLDEIPLDKWGHPFIYRSPGRKRPDSFDLSSPGKDGIPDTPDDISLDTR